jgi:hypothetical protein
LIQEQEYVQFWGGEFNSFQDIKKFPHCAPTRLQGTMTLANVRLYYVLKLLCKFELFVPIGS